MPVLLTILAIVCATAVDARAQPRALRNLVSLTIPAPPIMRPWVDAVLAHRPGESDSATLIPANWTRDEVRHFWIYMQLLAALLRGQAISPGNLAVRAGRPIYIQLPRGELDNLREIARHVQQVDRPDTFLKRASLLHTDVVRFVSDELAYGTGDVSMLMPQRVMIETEDGQQRSLRTGAVHWEIARVLLDQVPDAKRDTFVRDWYRATMKYKLGREELDASHFEYALRLFSDDSDIRFLTGCLHESLAEPPVQAARRRMKLPPNVTLAFGDTSLELSSAQSQFEQALERDAKHAEARMRLGRTLLRRGHVKEAIAELQRALDVANEPVQRYYVQLFLAAALEAAARFDDARRALDSALTLFPAAQAPRIALSQLAHRRGDRVEAERVLRDVLVPVSEKSRDDDPWWVYSTSCGRRSTDAFDALASRLPPIAPRP